MNKVELIEFLTVKGMRQQHIETNGGKDTCNCHYCVLARQAIQQFETKKEDEKA